MFFVFKDIIEKTPCFKHNFRSDEPPLSHVDLFIRKLGATHFECLVLFKIITADS